MCHPQHSQQHDESKPPTHTPAPQLLPTCSTPAASAIPLLGAVAGLQMVYLAHGALVQHCIMQLGVCSCRWPCSCLLLQGPWVQLQLALQQFARHVSKAWSYKRAV